MRITHRGWPVVVLATAAIALSSVPASAQVIGTFSWQTQPFCNTVTLTVVQQGGLFQVHGSDNQCGAGVAPVTGTAVPVGGNVAFGFTVALGSGRAAHLSATIALGTLSGTWTDADGNTGPFVFGASGGSNPRPAPAAVTAITVNQLAASIYGGSGAAATVARSDHDHDARYLEQAQPIVVSVPATGAVAAAGSNFTTFSTVGPVVAINGNGIVSVPLGAPASVGGTSYRLSAVEYCVAISGTGPYVDTAAVYSDDFNGALPFTLLLSDTTDRTASGCYQLNVVDPGARSFAAVLALAGAAPGGGVYLRGLRATWTPVAP